ncbi:MAG: FkbM family methyltransferase [Erysipelotrichia bacterium]|nr:FkbM family methyltransferase [Erysipelotrichia bacterium]
MLETSKKSLKNSYIGCIFRSLRDKLKFARRKHTKTPIGFLFFGNAQMETGVFEKEETKVFSRLFDSADFFVDIGANIGYFSCLACQKNLHVIAFEPMHSNLKYLYENLRQNNWQNQAEIFPVGLSDKPALVDIFGEGTGASLIEGWAGVSSLMRETIPVNTLDSLIGSRLNGKKTVVKMDIEGAEYRALCGAKTMLEQFPKPIWLVEITLDDHRQGKKNDNFQATFELFWEYGYEAYSIGSNPCHITRSKLDNYLTTGNKTNFETNYLFVDPAVNGMELVKC